MSEIRISKTFSFECSHRLLNSYTKACQNIHGHSYKVEVFLKRDSTKVLLSNQSTVVDFTKIKEIFKDQIEKEMDHKILLQDGDPLINYIPHNQIYIMKDQRVPTAECLAVEIFQILYESDQEISSCLEKVRVYETETSWAEYCETG